jgi:hypothetical protein
MPRGKGIYEDEPREHRHSYSPGSTNDDGEQGDDPAPDDSASRQSSEPTG